MRPFRFGVSFPAQFSTSEIGETLKRAEDAGFDVVCTADHLTERLAVFPFLATIAQVSSLRVSPMVLANDYRHPAITARDSATIDILSDGRFELGIGTGWIKEQYDAAGLTYDRPGVRVDRLEESVEVIKRLWTGDPISFDGDHYQLDGLASPKPVQDPRPPILIAGSGPRMMRFAGREADIVGISPLSPSLVDFDEFGKVMSTSGERVLAQLDWVKEGAGSRFDDIELSVAINHLETTDSAPEAFERLGSSWGSEPSDIADSLHVLVGSHEQFVAQLTERRERYGVSYVIFSAAVLDHVSPVVEQLAGT